MTPLIGRMDICRCAWHACPNCLGLEQLAVLSPPPSAGGHSVSGHMYTSALSEDASLHQQRHAKKVCLAAAYRKSANPYECKARASDLTSASASPIKPRHSSIDRLSRASTPPELKLLVSLLFIIFFASRMPAIKTPVSVA